MGDRVSVSFKDNIEESVCLFHHWGGKEFAEEAQDFLDKLREANSDNSSMMPIERLEPSAVMVYFIAEVARKRNGAVRSIYLGKDEGCGDNSDNGHFTIDCNTKP